MSQDDLTRFAEQIREQAERMTRDLHAVRLPDPPKIEIWPRYEPFDWRAMTTPGIEALADAKPYGAQIVELLTEQAKPSPPATETRGRKRTYDWERAGLAVLGAISRGDEDEPKSLAEVETMLGDWFDTHYEGKVPSEAMLRTHARIIWKAGGYKRG